jgi:hypothetical protein
MQELRVAPGPALGRLLEQLTEHVLEHPQDNERARLLELAARLSATVPYES